MELYCGGNQLTSLRVLPNSLIELYCSSNQLTNMSKTEIPKGEYEVFTHKDKMENIKLIF